MAFLGTISRSSGGLVFTPDSERHDLGEYYTPDWLAAKICRKVIKKPLTDRVIDPACGSGTFLFHAVRLNLAAAANATTESKRRAQVACGLIAGIDIHPVAVIIARVTFLLALGDTLATRAGGVTALSRRRLAAQRPRHVHGRGAGRDRAAEGRRRRAQGPPFSEIGLRVSRAVRRSAGNHTHRQRGQHAGESLRGADQGRRCRQRQDDTR